MAEQSKLSQSITVMFVLAALVVAGVTYLLLKLDPTKAAPGVAEQASPVTQEQAAPPQQMSNAGGASEPAPASTMDTATAPAPMSTEQGSAMPPATSSGEGEKPVAQSVSEAAEQPLSSVAPGEPESSPATSTLVPMADTAMKPDKASPASTPASSAPMTAATAPEMSAPASTSGPAAANTSKESEPAAAAFESSSSAKGDDSGLNKLGLRDAKWLMSQDPSSYSIQVIAVKGDKELSGFLDKNAELSKDQMAFFKRKSGGQDWLVLTYGVYPSLKAAVDAMNALPPMVKERHPWVRKLAYVHKDIQ